MKHLLTLRDLCVLVRCSYGTVLLSTCSSLCQNPGRRRLHGSRRPVAPIQTILPGPFLKITSCFPFERTSRHVRQIDGSDRGMVEHEQTRSSTPSTTSRPSPRMTSHLRCDSFPGRRLSSRSRRMRNCCQCRMLIPLQIEPVKEREGVYPCLFRRAQLMGSELCVCQFLGLILTLVQLPPEMDLDAYRLYFYKWQRSAEFLSVYQFTTYVS